MPMAPKKPAVKREGGGGTEPLLPVAVAVAVAVPVAVAVGARSDDANKVVGTAVASVDDVVVAAVEMEDNSDEDKEEGAGAPCVAAAGAAAVEAAMSNNELIAALAVGPLGSDGAAEAASWVKTGTPKGTAESGSDAPARCAVCSCVWGVGV